MILNQHKQQIYDSAHRSKSDGTEKPDAIQNLTAKRKPDCIMATQIQCCLCCNASGKQELRTTRVLLTRASEHSVHLLAREPWGNLPK